nr:copia protein [Tanacetum cinerariifolium]
MSLSNLFFSVTLIVSSLSKSSSIKGDVLEGGGVSSNVTLSDSLILMARLVAQCYNQQEGIDYDETYALVASKAYIILNKHTIKIKESLNVTFDETPPPSKTSPLIDDDLDEEETIKVTEKKSLERDIEDETLEIDEIIFSNPPNVDPNMEEFYTRQTKILTRQVQLGDEQRGGIRSIWKGIKNLWRKKKKYLHSLLMFPAIKQLARKWWDEYGFVIHLGFPA